MIYFAYGSNLNLDQMERRCPAAEPISKLVLPNWRLVFRGVCDVIPEDGAEVQGGIWKITEDCERRLDSYEGFRRETPDDGMYSKVMVKVDGLPDGETEVMVYVMNSTGIFPPSSSYFAGVKQGYQDFDLPLKPLMTALEASYDDKAPTHVERRRMRRTGRPPLAARPSIVAAQDKRPLTRKQERKAAKKAMRKAERRATAKANHDPWADTSWARPKKRPSLDQWLADKYYNGERF